MVGMHGHMCMKALPNGKRHLMEQVREQLSCKH
jgi:hypothetical protein